MTRRTIRLFTALPLLAALCGCGAAGRLYQKASGYRLVRVPTGGMSPTINPGQMAWVDTEFYDGHEVQRFDIVMFRVAPENALPGEAAGAEGPSYVQRVIGLGGETVEVKGGTVYINGRWLEETFVTQGQARAEVFGPLVIPEGQYFLLGDNRPDSYDSRFWPRPTLDRSLILGKVVEIIEQ